MHHRLFNWLLAFYRMLLLLTVCFTVSIRAFPQGTYQESNQVIETNPTTVMLAHASTSTIASFIPPAYLSTSGGVTTVSNYPDYILFDGTFSVDNNISFVNCPKMVFHPNATIYVGAGKTLTINSSTLSASCNEMWTGIQNFNGGTVHITNSTIRDMEDGIKSDGGSVVNCSNNIFENDWQGIWLQGTPVNYAGVIHNNTFKSTGSFCLPPQAGKKTWMGIRIEKYCKYVDIGGWSSTNPAVSYGNTFDNVQTGIYIFLPAGAVNPPYVYNLHDNKFSNITGGNYGLSSWAGANPVSLYNDYPGTAVYALNYGYPSIATVTVDAPSLSSVPNFDNCTKGVTLSGMSANILNTKLANVLWGLNFDRTNFYDYSIHNNALINAFYAINFNGDTKSAQVYSNSISSASQSTVFNYMLLSNPIAINVNYFTPGTNYNFNVSLNGITMNAPGGTGISLRNRGISLYQNNIALSSGASASNLQRLYGINVVNARGAQISCNTISGNTALVSAVRPDAVGIYMSDSRDMLVSCNTVTLEKYGFQVIGNCLTASKNVNGNMFSNHINGMLFRHLGSPGTFGNIGDPQNDNNNQFQGTMYGYQNGFLMKVYRVSNCQPPFPNDGIFTSNNTLNNNESGGNNANCKYQVLGNNAQHSIMQCHINCLVEHDFPVDIGDVGLAERIAQDSVLYSEYQQGASWLAAQRLYYDLYYDTAARNSSAVLDSFFLAMQNTPIGNLKITDDLLQAVNETFGQDTSAYYEWLQRAKDANDDMVSSEQQELNEQIINDLYLKYIELGVDSLNAADSSTIAGLALQCPMVGGAAVYKARTMYALYVSFDYNDLDICNNQGYFKGSHGLFDEENAALSMQYLPSTAQKHISIYPNPNSGKFTIQYMLEQGEEGKVQITDLQGRLIEEVVLNPMLSFQQMDLGKQASGIYFYRFVVNGLTRYSGKIEVIK